MSYKYFLGIQSYANADSGASLIRVNQKTKKIEYVCISEERLIRKKHPYTFPLNSIKYCLDYFDLKDLRKVDYVISDWIKIKRWHVLSLHIIIQNLIILKKNSSLMKKNYSNRSSFSPRSECFLYK